MVRLLLVLMPLVTVFSGPAIVLASAPVIENAPMLIISGWGPDAMSQVEAAGGQIVGPENAPLGVFAYSDDIDFADKLRAQGAWAVINGAKIAAICGVDT